MTLEVGPCCATSLSCLTWPHLQITPCNLALFSNFTRLNNCLSFTGFLWFWSTTFSLLLISGKPIKWQGFNHLVSTQWWLKLIRHPGTIQVGKIFVLRADTSFTTVPLIYSTHTRTCRHLETCILPNQSPIGVNTPQACLYLPFSSTRLVSKQNLTHHLERQSTPLAFHSHLPFKAETACPIGHHHTALNMNPKSSSEGKPRLSGKAKGLSYDLRAYF